MDAKKQCLAVGLTIAAVLTPAILRYLKNGKKVTVTKLVVYPIKSCKGVSVQSAELLASGLRFDRSYMLVDNLGAMLSMRRLPRMALIEPSLPTSENEVLNEVLVVNAPGMETIRVPVVTKSTGGTITETEVWDNLVLGVDQGNEIAVWLSSFLQLDGVRLLRAPQPMPRPHVEAKWGGGFRTAYPDGFPVLVTSEASLEELNRRLPSGSEPMTMERFRPNVVLSGCPPHDEDRWTELRSSHMCLRMMKLCDRCVMPNVDPSTGKITKSKENERRMEPTHTLRKYRLAQTLCMPRTHNAPYKVDNDSPFFGNNAIVEMEGRISVGDRVHPGSWAYLFWV